MPPTFASLLTISRTTTCAIVALLLGPGTAAAAQTREIDLNGLYPAGTRLSSPLTGITFRLPDGFRAEWDASLGGLLSQATDGALGAIWGWSDGTAEEVASEIGSRLEAQGIELQARGEPEMTPDGMRGVFEAVTETGRGVLHALIRTGPQGGVIAVAGLGGSGAEATAAAFVDDIEASLQWARPGAGAWREQVVGTVLTTGASPSQATLSFCSPTQYAYQESSESYVSIPGASASSSSSDQHSGDWWLVADLAGTPTLFLEATDGRTFQWSVEESGDGFLIDGYRYRVSGTC